MKMHVRDYKLPSGARVEVFITEDTQSKTAPKPSSSWTLHLDRIVANVADVVVEDEVSECCNAPAGPNDDVVSVFASIVPIDGHSHLQLHTESKGASCRFVGWAIRPRLDGEVEGAGRVERVMYERMMLDSKLANINLWLRGKVYAGEVFVREEVFDTPTYSHVMNFAGVVANDIEDLWYRVKNLIADEPHLLARPVMTVKTAGEVFRSLRRETMRTVVLEGDCEKMMSMLARMVDVMEWGSDYFDANGVKSSDLAKLIEAAEGIETERPEYEG